MVILNPIEQTINNITVFSAHRDWVPVNATTNQSQSNVNRCFLNIIIKTVIAPSFRINGSPPTGNFTPIPGTDYSYLQENITSMAVSAPVQNLKADSSFIAIAYGYGNYESYGYNAGTSVRDLSQVIEVNNVYGTAPFPSTCTIQDFQHLHAAQYDGCRCQVEDAMANCRRLRPERGYHRIRHQAL
jgi:hypothetical protein